MIRTYIILGTIVFLLTQPDNLFGQDNGDNKQPFQIRTHDGPLIDISYFIIKADKKTYEFEMDTSSTDYKSLNTINPDWIKSIEILNNKQLDGGQKKVVIMTLKRKKLNKLPDDFRDKFR